MINKYRPYFLPQLTAPEEFICSYLDKEGISYTKNSFNPDELIPTQSIVFLDNIKNNQPFKPIWCNKEKKILDGHHRLGNSLSYGNQIESYVIDLDFFDSVRVLNKIQDIYDYISFENKENKETEITDYLEFIENELKNELSNSIINNDKDRINTKKKKIRGYRKDDINNNSLIGNFFSLKPVEGYKIFEIEFDNLLDTENIGVNFYGSTNPVEHLSKLWFPNYNFDEMSKKYGISKENIINRCVSEKAKKMGYDGIKYGDIIIHGLN